MSVHPAVHGFDRTAAAYERARPSYPAAALDWLSERLGIAPGRRVLDLAAGTGKLTRLLVARGAEVVAVEPIAGMRAELCARVPGVPVLDGTAEAIPLENASVDAVTVAQAFHWFRVEEALTEIRRVLRPGGGLGLIWNGANSSDPAQAALREIIDRHRGPNPPPHCTLGDRRAHAERWRPRFEASGMFGPLEHAAFEYVQTLARDALPDRVGSISMIGALPAEEREAALAEVRRLAETLDDPVQLRYFTDAYVAAPR